MHAMRVQMWQISNRSFSGHPRVETGNYVFLGVIKFFPEDARLVDRFHSVTELCRKVDSVYLN